MEGTQERFVEQLLSDPSTLVTAERSTVSREAYVERILRGGFPLAVARASGPSRNRWFDDYLRARPRARRRRAVKH